MAPGILYVKMQPSSDLPAAQFQDWYNNEHGPLRLRLSTFVTNGFRYRAADADSFGKGKPEWMAMYDITDMDELLGDVYMTLRDAPIQSQRERDLRPSIKIDRRSYDLVRSWEADGFTPLEDVQKQTEGTVLVAGSIRLQPGHKVEELDKWYEEEHIPLLSKIPGWQRSRRFVTSTIDKKPEGELEYLALHDFAAENGLDNGQFAAAADTPRAKEIISNATRDGELRKYALYYRFGPAPRDLSILAGSKVPSFDSPATKTKTIPSPSGAGVIESYVTTPDGVQLPYRLEGATTDPDAPLIVLCNSILVEWGIWDAFVAQFLASSEGKAYRVLRYHTRGRYGACGDKPVTVDLLAADMIALLDALRVPKAAAAVGVSLGGATVLCAGLKYPKRIERFLSCDTSAKSPEGNDKLWGERIAMSEKEGAVDAQGEKVVGEELAEKTVRRWFVPESYDGGEMEATCEGVKKMVVNNSFEGFKKSVEALWDYDLRSLMKGYKGKGKFLAGSGDGALPKGMKGMAEQLGENGSECVVVEGAGHLPMVEKPREVAEAVTKLLST